MNDFDDAGLPAPVAGALATLVPPAPPHIADSVLVAVDGHGDVPGRRRPLTAIAAALALVVAAVGGLAYAGRGIGDAAEPERVLLLSGDALTMPADDALDLAASRLDALKTARIETRVTGVTTSHVEGAEARSSEMAQELERAYAGLPEEEQARMREQFDEFFDPDRRQRDGLQTFVSSVVGEGAYVAPDRVYAKVTINLSGSPVEFKDIEQEAIRIGDRLWSRDDDSPKWSTSEDRPELDDWGFLGPDDVRSLLDAERRNIRDLGVTDGRTRHIEITVTPTKPTLTETVFEIWLTDSGDVVQAAVRWRSEESGMKSDDGVTISDIVSESISLATFTDHNDPSITVEPPTD